MKIKSLIGYFYVALILVVSSGTSITRYYDNLLIATLIIGISIVAIKRIHLKFERLFFIPLVILFFYSIIELIVTGSILYSIYLRLITVILVVYLGFLIVSDFWYKTERLIYYSAILSLFFFTLQIAGGSAFLSVANSLAEVIVPGSGISGDLYFIIFNVDNTFINLGDIRNSGFMWEPGAFALVLILGMILLYLREGITKETIKMFMVYSVVVLTTVSTTGFFALFLFVMVLLPHRNKLVLISTSAFLILVFLMMATYFEFLIPKVQEQLFSADDVIVNEGLYASAGIRSLGRFGSVIAAFRTIETSPLFGIGMNDDFFFQGAYISFRYTNGLGDVLAKMGIFGLILLYYNLRKLFKTLAIEYKRHLEFWHYDLMTLIFFILFFSNTAVFFPLFLGMQIYHLRFYWYAHNQK